MVPPVLERYYGNRAGYQQASIQVGQSITKDSWYGCVEYQEVSLFTKDGTEISLMQGLSGSGCSGGNKDYPEEGYLQLNRRPDTYELIDMDSLDQITICGVEIPLS